MLPIQVNGEPQKRAQEISAEVAVALTLSELHPEAGGLSCDQTKINACASITSNLSLHRPYMGSFQTRCSG